jgi:hypothetical protein
VNRKEAKKLFEVALKSKGFKLPSATCQCADATCVNCSGRCSSPAVTLLYRQNHLPIKFSAFCCRCVDHAIFGLGEDARYGDGEFLFDMLGQQLYDLNCSDEE